MEHQLLLDHLSRHIAISDDDVNLVKSHFRLKKLRKKQFLLLPGEVARFENFVTKGCLRAFYVDKNGEDHIVQFAVEDWWIGDMFSFLTGQPSNYTIEALEATEVLQIEKHALEELYQKMPELNRFFRIIIQNAFVASQQRVLDAMSKSAEERYQEFIRRYPTIEQRVPQYQVAAYLGITPEFLSRLRKKFTGR